MKFNPSEPRPYARRGVTQPGRWEIDLRGTLDNGLEVKRERRVFPASPSGGKIGKRQAAAMAFEEWQRWNRCGQVLRPGEKPPMARTGAMAPGHVPTFAQFAPDYLEFCASPSGGPRGANAKGTLVYKESDLRLHLLPIFGKMRLDQLVTTDVDRYVLAKTKEGYEPSSIVRHVAILRRMLILAKRFKILDAIPELHSPKEKRGTVTALDPYEAERFRAATKVVLNEHCAMLLELYLRTGLRTGEGLGLYPADLDLSGPAPVIHVRRSYGPYGYGPTKSGRARTVPVPPSLAERAEAFLAQEGISARSSSVPLFRSSVSPERPYHPAAVLKWVARVGTAANTRRVHTHMLRHTFGTECARRGVPLLTLKEWMGHSSVKTTMVYLHLAAPDHLRWASLLGD